MHAYSTDTKERIRVPFLIGVVSVFLHIGLIRILPPSLLSRIGLSGFGISIGLIFAIFFTLFNRWCWKWKIWRWLGLVQIPDINGQWQGYVKTSYDKLQKKYPLSVRIKQNWFNISIDVKAEQSESYSFTGSILVKADEGTIIHYAYKCKPTIDSDEDLKKHLGTTLVAVKGDQLIGEYFTSYGRSNTGYIKLTKIKQNTAQN